MTRIRGGEHGAGKVHLLADLPVPGQPFVHRTPEGRTLYFHLLSEVELSGRQYAMLRTPADHPDEVFLYRIDGGAAREIDHDNEWETVAEAVDEMLYFHDSKL